MSKFRVLVSGGRSFGVPQRDTEEEKDQADKEQRFMFDKLNALLIEHPDFILIHGAARGADSLSASWAEWKKLEVIPVPANWKKFQSAAGPLRNEQMLAEQHPDLVLAFMGNSGTKHMVSISRRDGIRTIHYLDIE